MVRLFFWLALIITLIFFVLAMIFAIFQWIIYFRVEYTTLHTNRDDKR